MLSAPVVLRTPQSDTHRNELKLKPIGASEGVTDHRHAQRSRLRDDDNRIKAVAAVQGSGIGTKRTTSNVRLESAFGGKAEAGFRGREGRC
jgi:hypothetical protein